MSSRVQKGGPKFKPVAKARSRPGDVASRQASSVPEPADLATFQGVMSLRPSEHPTIPIDPVLTQNISIDPALAGIVDHMSGANAASSSLSSEGLNQAPAAPAVIPSSAVRDTDDSSSHPQRAMSQPTGGQPIGAPSRSIPTVNPTASNIVVPSQAHLPPDRVPAVLTSDAAPAPALNANTVQNTIPPSNAAISSDNHVSTGSSIIPGTQPSEDLSSQVSGPSTRSTRSTRKRSSTRQSNGGADTDNASTSSGKPRGKRRKTAQTPAPFDPDADPGEELDPTTVTMATICEDTGHGRVSSKAADIVKNHLAWKVANKAKRERMRAVQEAKKYGRDEDADETPSNPVDKMDQASSSQGTTGPSSATEGDPGETSGDDFNYAERLSTNRFHVQVRIGPNGETIVDEETLFVDRADETELAAQDYTHVEESDQTKFVNSATYSKKVTGSRWTAEETDLFYHALSQFGENYELISLIMPGRDRKACKNKFKAEDKRNPNRINYCLKNRIPYDMQTLSRLTGKDFSGPLVDVAVPQYTPAPPPRPQASDETSQAGSAHTPAPSKRGRKKRVSQNQDVEVIGGVDDFAMEDEQEGTGIVT